MPGFHAFPGGRVDRDDDSFRTAAVRELEEETGVTVSASDFEPAGHWITPPFMPKRFDTRFYLAWLPQGQDPTHDAHEHEHGEWIRPVDAVAQWARGEALLAPPVLHILRVLAEHPPEAWAEQLAADPQAQGGQVKRIEFRPGVRLVPLRSMTIPPATHTNCYIVGDDNLVVIDPGATEDDHDDLYEALNPLLDGGAKLSAILITHHHIDHVAGANVLRERTGAPLWAHRDTAQILGEAVRFDRTLADGDRIELAGASVGELVTLHTPGHAQGHLCFIDPEHHTLFTGDLIVGFGTVVVDPPDGNMAAYMASLTRLVGMDIDTMFPGHGPVMGAGDRVVQRYIKHRQAREEKVVAALRAGHRTPQDMLPTVYDDVPPALHAFAERSLLAVLEKLSSEGRVAAVDDGWQLT